MDHVKKSVELFGLKFNCAQAVFASFSEDLGLDEKQALKIGGCFGSVCVKFLEEFAEKNGSYICNDLLGCDIRTKEGVEYAKENNLFTEICPKMVESAASIVEEIIKE